MRSLALDITDTDALTEAVGDLEIDVLVNNAGVSRTGNILTADAWDVDEQVAVNIHAVLHLVRLLMPGMVRRDRGHIVNVSSIAGVYNFGGNTVYHATKAAVHTLSRQLRVDGFGRRVRVTEICPGASRPRSSVGCSVTWRRPGGGSSTATSHSRRRTSPTPSSSPSGHRGTSTSATSRSCPPSRCPGPGVRAAPGLTPRGAHADHSRGPLTQNAHADFRPESDGSSRSVRSRSATSAAACESGWTSGVQRDIAVHSPGSAKR
ncbi:SDR family NAD(P)-dependent oxidoreductase [Streptomyces sp. M19]